MLHARLSRDDGDLRRYYVTLIPFVPIIAKHEAFSRWFFLLGEGQVRMPQESEESASVGYF